MISAGSRLLAILPLVGDVVDTMIASALVDENQLRYDLNHCARRYTGKGKDEGLFIRSCKRVGE